MAAWDCGLYGYKGIMGFGLVRLYSGARGYSVWELLGFAGFWGLRDL